MGMTEDEQDRAEIYDLFNRYADAVAGRQWTLLDEVFTEDVTSNWPGPAEIEGRGALVRRIRDVIERTSETHVLGNYTATIDGDVAEASVRFGCMGSLQGTRAAALGKSWASSGPGWCARGRGGGSGSSDRRGTQSSTPCYRVWDRPAGE